MLWRTRQQHEIDSFFGCRRYINTDWQLEERYTLLTARLVNTSLYPLNRRQRYTDVVSKIGAHIDGGDLRPLWNTDSTAGKVSGFICTGIGTDEY